MLSKDSEKILKELKKQQKNYREKEAKEGETSKLSYDEIKDLFPGYAHIQVIMFLKYLLEERYIYNHLDGKEHHFGTKELQNGSVQIVIGERGVAYLENKKYMLLAKTIPVSVSVISLIISLINLFIN
ncbi:hypothetical protein CSV74_00250 [Sporosarcina sp. P19]|uniref:hypothetical protein n=1 Tax=Sporosarcina sp. P19 TaxID=2048258 RepID=UPI000C172D9D|nr:hypothetical protein [Sporosarcina sp. P19]PIC77993.1 hypothetical protein CSV74_00250 [Sporosarcina sp. P19]